MYGWRMEYVVNAASEWTAVFGVTSSRAAAAESGKAP